MEMKLELVTVPVSDVDRAKSFYVDKVGFNADYDHKVKPGLRFVQLTPPGSACSIAIGEGLTEMKPGSQKGLQVVVKNAQAVRDKLVKNGIDASEVQVMPWVHLYFSRTLTEINGQFSSFLNALNFYNFLSFLNPFI